MGKTYLQRSDAEAEADRLSANIHSQTPEGVRSEMCSRLGADLSGVRFHSDASSVHSNEAMNARAFTEGSDIHFGGEGFSPSLAAHELVHTVQQGAVPGNTGVSVPYGSVQLKPKEKGDKISAEDFAQDEGPLEGDVKSLADVESQVLRAFASGRGVEVYNAIAPDLIAMIRKHKKDPQQRLKYNPRIGVSFLVRAAFQDYALRDIITEIAGKGIGVFKTKTRIRQYKALIQRVSERLGEYQTEELAYQTGMLNRAPGQAQGQEGQERQERQVDKRAYDFKESKNDSSPEALNPGNIPEVAAVQQEIDEAGSLEEAYKAFARFTGNKKGEVQYINEADKDVYNVDLGLAKLKLKNMARMVWDYPELRNLIGSLRVQDKDWQANMAVNPTGGGWKKTAIQYNAFRDREGPEGEAFRQADNKYRAEHNHWNANRHHLGNHELGHVLGSSLVSPNSDYEAGQKENSRYQTENDIIKEVFLKGDVLTPVEKKQILIYKKDGTHPDLVGNSVKDYKNNVNVRESLPFRDPRITSYYGGTSAGEFFAETFGDIYTHGSNAKKASIATVKEYEKRQKERQLAIYKYNQSVWYKKLFRKKIIR